MESGSLGNRFSQAVVGLVVIYHAPPDVSELLNELLRQVGKILVVDNGSSPAERAMLQEWATSGGAALIKNDSNLGLATALNQGFKWAVQQGAEWVLTFDQDSLIAEGFARRIISCLAGLHNQKGIAALGPQIVDRETNVSHRWLRARPWGFERRDCPSEYLADVTFVITSGSLTRTAAWLDVGGFNDGLFIDYIDHEFCLRCRRKGWHIGVCGTAILFHRLGSRRSRELLGIHAAPLNHTSLRHYYMARNRIVLWKTAFPSDLHWCIFDLSFAILNTLRVLTLESCRVRKIVAICVGTWDGLCGRMGRIDAKRECLVIGKHKKRI